MTSELKLTPWSCSPNVTEASTTCNCSVNEIHILGPIISVEPVWFLLYFIYVWTLSWNKQQGVMLLFYHFFYCHGHNNELLGKNKQTKKQQHLLQAQGEALSRVWTALWFISPEVTERSLNEFLWNNPDDLALVQIPLCPSLIPTRFGPAWNQSLLLGD